MKPRARRVTLAAAVLGTGIVSVILVLNWGTVCDHVEAWHIQLTRETVTVVPSQLSPSDTGLSIALGDLANHSGQPVVFAQVRCWIKELSHTPTVDAAAQLLRDNGFRVLEQRFPRRAYVVIRDPVAEPVVSQTLLVPFVTPAE